MTAGRAALRINKCTSDFKADILWGLWLLCFSPAGMRERTV